MTLVRNIAILGSTGSIGTQALEIIRANTDLFKVSLLTAHANTSLLIEQALEFRPEHIVVTNVEAYEKVQSVLNNAGLKVYCGNDSLISIIHDSPAEIVLAAMVGFAGLLPVEAAIKSRKKIALANKETLVVAGELIMQMAKQYGSEIIPVDSEHSAIFQCLIGEKYHAAEKIILTASGGPFRGKKKGDLINITKADALRHPNWSMGAKITIDSATLMNKGLEMIEARWLFDLEPLQIEAIIHPQSIIHSLVQFCDGSIKAQMGLPDMKLPIHYAFTYPERHSSQFQRFSFAKFPALTFEEPDEETFRCMTLARMAMETGKTMPCILNAANEVTVAAFLNDEISFNEIAFFNEEVMQAMKPESAFNVSDYVEVDRQARQTASRLISAKKNVSS